MNLAELCVLIVGGGMEQKRSCAKKLPRYARAAFSSQDPCKLEEAIFDHSPDIVFLLFGKGEKVSAKNFDPLYSYCRDNDVYLAVYGSRLQHERIQNGYDAYSGGLKVGKLTPSSLEGIVSMVRERKRSQKRAKLAEKETRKKLIAVISADIRVFAYCDRLIDPHDAECGDVAAVYCDPRVDMPERFKELSQTPSLFICTFKNKGEAAAVLELLSDEKLAGVPVIVPDIEGLYECNMYNGEVSEMLGERLHTAKAPVGFSELVKRLLNNDEEELL